MYSDIWQESVWSGDVCSCECDCLCEVENGLPNHLHEHTHPSQTQGHHLFQTCPSSNYYDCKAMAIGARSQSARTYLENKLEDFGDCELYKCTYISSLGTEDVLISEVS